MSKNYKLGVGINARGATEGATKFEKASNKIINGAKRINRDVTEVDKRLLNLGGTAGKIKGLIAGALSGYTAAKGIRVIAQYEQAMVTLKGVTGATGDQFADLNATARDLGATTQYSAAEAAGGLLFLARAGFDTNEAIKAIPDTLNLAATSGMSLAESADHASNILSQFAMDASETVEVVDALTNVSNNANTDVRQLAEALKYVGPVAGSLGIDIEQTASAIGVLGDSGIQASMAGTSLRMILSQLINPSKEARNHIESLGLSLEEIDPRTNKLVDVFRRFRDAGLDAAKASDIFGIRAYSSALILSQNADRVEELTAITKIFGGVTDDLAQEKMDTLIGRFKGLQSTLQELALQSGDAGLLGFMKDGIQDVTEILRSMGGLEAELSDNQFAVMQWAKAGGAYVEYFASSFVDFAGYMTRDFPGAIDSSLLAISSVFEAFFRQIVLGAQEVGPAILEGITSKAASSKMSKAYAVSSSWEEIYNANSTKLLYEKQKRVDRQNQVRSLTGEEALPRAILSDAERGNLAAGAKDEAGRLFDERALDEAFVRVTSNYKKQSVQILSDLKSDLAGVVAQAGDGVYSSQMAENKVQLEASLEAISAMDNVKVATSQGGEAVEQWVDQHNNWFDSLADSLKSAQQQLGPTRESFAALPAVDKKVVAGKNAIDQMVMALREEAGMLEFSSDQREKAVALLELEKTARQHGVVDISAQRQEMSELIDSIQAVTKAKENQKQAAQRSKNAYESADLIVASLKQEIELVGLVNDERERSIQLAQLDAMSQDMSAKDVAKYRAEINGLMDDLKHSNDMQQMADNIEMSFENTFQSIIAGTASVKDAFKSLAADILSIMTRQMIAEPLARGIMGMFGGLGGGTTTTTNPVSSGFTAGNITYGAHANGAVYHNGSLQAFAAGGVVDSPTYFPTSTGKGLMGEAGPEAIMPLKRDSAGRLGVAGGGSNATVINEIKVINESKNEVAAETSSAKFDGEKWVTTVILKDFNKGGPISKQMRSLR